MSRIRNIKPDFYKNEKIAELPRDIRYFFKALWTQCDCRGVFEWRPRLLKLELLPFDADVSPERIESWLAALVVARCAYEFTVGSKKFGVVHDFLEHQRISKRELEQGPRFPPPPSENQGDNLGTTLGTNLGAQDIGHRTQDGGGEGTTQAHPNPPPPSCSSMGEGKAADRDGRLRALLVRYEFSANALALVEFTSLIRKTARCRTWDEADAFLRWIREVADREGATIRHARHAVVLAGQWDEYGRAKNFAKAGA